MVGQAAAAIAAGPPPAVEVFDGVFSASARAVLASAVDAPAGIYRRVEGATTSAEHAIESLLVGAGDVTTREVEYWSREEWVGMEAHRDVDEEAACCDGELRMPSRVMIVDGECEAGLRAPTVLWDGSDAAIAADVDDGGGGGDGGAGNGGGGDGGGGNGGGGGLVVVPAVPGRVLSFSGSLLHAVPKPATEWLE